MGRKKKKQSKPWCWYCNREFEDEKILIQHQKAKHFKCHICNKKLFTGPGLAIHCMQVHKETIDKIPGAVPGRDNVNIEVYGMEGVPIDAEIGNIVDSEQPVAKQPKLNNIPTPTLPTPAGFPPMPPYPFMPPFMPQLPMPVGMSNASPFGMPVPGILPGTLPPTIPISLSGVTPVSVQPAFPAYQSTAKTEAGVIPTGGEQQITNTGAAAVRPIIAKTRIVCPDESISLEEHKFHIMQQTHQFVPAVPAQARGPLAGAFR